MAVKPSAPYAAAILAQKSARLLAAYRNFVDHLQGALVGALVGTHDAAVADLNAFTRRVRVSSEHYRNQMLRMIESDFAEASQLVAMLAPATNRAADVLGYCATLKALYQDDSAFIVISQISRDLNLVERHMGLGILQMRQRLQAGAALPQVQMDALRALTEPGTARIDALGRRVRSERHVYLEYNHRLFDGFNSMMLLTLRLRGDTNGRLVSALNVDGEVVALDDFESIRKERLHPQSQVILSPTAY